MAKTGKPIYVDNTNLSKKGRANYIREARKYGYIVQAILVPVDLQTILDRQDTRQDKFVPLDAVEQQYMRLNLPSLGEVDRIITYAGNLP
jgi:gluconate kinase